MMKTITRDPFHHRALRAALLAFAGALLLEAPLAPARAQSAPPPPAPADGTPAEPAASDAAPVVAAADSTPLAWPAPAVADSNANAWPEPVEGVSADTASGGTQMNARITVVRKVRLEKSARNVVRSGPGERFSIVGVYAKHASFPIIAKNGDWYGVRLSETETGWIHASLCEEFDDLSGLEFRPNPRLYTRTGTFILTGYSGGYAFDRKSNSLVLGGRLGYYVFDRVQVEGGVGWTHVHRPAEIVESLFGLSLEAEDFHMLFYHLMATYEVLPGRQMVPYLSVGVGSSIMQGETASSVDIGAGTTLFLSKRTAMRWEVRDYRFDTGTSKTHHANNNIEFTLGTSVLF